MGYKKDIMRVLGVAAGILLTGSGAWAQENLWSSNTSGDSVSVIDATSLAADPWTPNPIALGTPTGPRSMFYDPIRKLVYAINTTGASVTAIDPILFTKTTLAPASVSKTFCEATLSQDGRWLFIGGYDAGGNYGVFQYDLNNFTATGVTFIPGPVLAGTITVIDTEVLPASATGGAGNGPGRVYLSVSQATGSVALIITPRIIEFDLLANTATTVPPPAGTAGMTPIAYARMTRSPDNTFILVATSSQATLAPTAWQVLRINPTAAPEMDFFNIPTPNASEVVDDIAFITTASSPFGVCMLARDNKTYAPQYFTVGATGAPSNISSGPPVPAQFGGELTPDLANNRIYVSWNGNTSFPNGLQVLSPATPAGTFLATAPDSGGPGPQKCVRTPKPPPMAIDYVVEPAGNSVSSFQLEIHGHGFLPNSSRAEVKTPAGLGTFATTSTVLGTTEILATFPGGLGVTNFDVVVVNNDGQTSTLASFFQGLSASPPSPPAVASLPPLTTGYQMLSYPQYATVGDLRAAINAQLGGYNPVQFRLFMWQSSRYIEINDPNLSPAVSLMGVGLFAISRYGTSLSLSTPDVTQNTTGARRVVAIPPGWNIISQPYIAGATNTMTYTNLQVSGTPDLGTTPPADSTPMVSNVLYEPSGGSYVPVSAMVAGKAYWILNQTSGQVYLIFRQLFVTKATVPSGTSPSASLSPPPPPGSLADGSSSSHCGLIGPELLLVALFRRLLRRRRLAA
jgi:hypothetical protein